MMIPEKNGMPWSTGQFIQCMMDHVGMRFFLPCEFCTNHQVKVRQKIQAFHDHLSEMLRFVCDHGHRFALVKLEKRNYPRIDQGFICQMVGVDL